MTFLQLPIVWISHSWYIVAGPGKVVYDWHVTLRHASPDCFGKQTIAINGEFQPTITVRQGQVLQVHLWPHYSVPGHLSMGSMVAPPYSTPSNVMLLRNVAVFLPNIQPYLKVETFPFAVLSLLKCCVQPETYNMTISLSFITNSGQTQQIAAMSIRRCMILKNGPRGNNLHYATYNYDWIASSLVICFPVCQGDHTQRSTARLPNQCSRSQYPLARAKPWQPRQLSSVERWSTLCPSLPYRDWQQNDVPLRCHRDPWCAFDRSSLQNPYYNWISCTQHWVCRDLFSGKWGSYCWKIQIPWNHLSVLKQRNLLNKKCLSTWGLRSQIIDMSL